MEALWFPEWRPRVYLLVCTAFTWMTLVALERDKWCTCLSYDTARNRVTDHLRRVVTSEQTAKIMALIDSSVGAWAYRAQMMHQIALETTQAKLALDFRPIVVRVPPLEAVGLRAACERLLDLETTVVSAASSTAARATIEAHHASALPFSSVLFPSGRINDGDRRPARDL